MHGLIPDLDLHGRGDHHHHRRHGDLHPLHDQWFDAILPIDRDALLGRLHIARIDFHVESYRLWRRWRDEWSAFERLHDQRGSME